MRVMLVDDDPFSIEKLKSRIMQLGEELQHAFEIVAECYSGHSALEQIPIVQPDAVFTDIQMASVNGIELAKAIQLRWPNVPVVIFSAYPTFEYAREAMRANVVEYLLKPIDSAALKDVLQKLLYVNRNKIYLQTQTILHSIISLDHDQEISELVRQTIFPFSGYRILLIQNVDAIYDVRLLMPKYEIDYDPLLQQLNHLLEERENVWFLPSDDGRSILLIVGLYNKNTENLPVLLALTQQFFTKNGISPTIVYSELFENLLEIKSKSKQLYVALSERIVIGKPQLISLAEPYQEPSAHFSELDEKRISAILVKNDTGGLRSLVMNLFSVWEKNGCTSMMLEINLKQIVQLLEHHYRKSNTSQLKNLEVRIEELIHTSRTFTDLAETFFAMLVSSFQLPDSTENAGASIQLFSQIEMYISANIGQPLSLQVLTDQFHVSRTVLCNLFRDYSGKSFVEYITSARMKMAQQLMRDYPEMLNKEIAEIIGYADQNYFSHVFKTVTEMSPTKYRESLGKDGSTAS